MGVYIKGMEMPKSWRDCLFANGAAQCGLVNHEICAREICPLIPVPQHGRLIDADALEKDVDETYAEVLKKIKNATPSGEDFGKPPIWKNGQGMVHADKADGTAENLVSKWAEWTCPTCGWFVGEQYILRRHNQQKSNFCSRCGQKIDWDEATSMEASHEP